VKTLVAVIAYNEGKNINKTLRDLDAPDRGYDIVVIDNASIDDTAAVCISAGVKILSHCVNTGGAFGTVMTYFQYAYENNYDILCQFDGDGQHIASELSKIIEPIENGEADYVIGSRFIEKEGFQSFFFRKLGIKLFSFLDSLFLGKKVTDVTSGFRAYSKEVIRFFATHYKHEIHDTNQLLLLSHFAGARIHEVPVRMREREHGESEFNFLKALAFPLKGFVNIVGCLLQKRQIQDIIRVPDGK
jgi:glycosyltransferase involved in cell wall biosynthesis